MQFNTLSDCIEYYQNYHLTKHKYANRAKHLEFFDSVALEDLRKHHIKKYHILRIEQNATNATVNREISFARASINCVNRDFELHLHNAFEDIKFVEDDHIPNYLTFDQYKSLLLQCKKMGYDDLHDFIVLLTMTGCRPNELLTLDWSNVHFEKRFFIVRNCWSKSKRTLYKYLNDTAYQLLLERSQNKKGAWVFTNTKTNKPMGSYHKIFVKVRQELDFYCTFYDLRHTYASWLVQGSVSIYTVKDLMGHTDISSTMRYAHLDYSTFVNALKVIG